MNIANIIEPVFGIDTRIQVIYSKHAVARAKQRLQKNESYREEFYDAICVAQSLNRRLWVNDKKRIIWVTIDLFDENRQDYIRLVVTMLRLGRLKKALKLIGRDQGEWYE